MSGGQRQALIQEVEAHLLGCLPPCVPPSWRSIEGARLQKGGRTRTIVADLIMFDGSHGRVEVFRAGVALDIPIIGHRWIELGNGPFSYEDGAWIRIDPKTLEPLARATATAPEIRPQGEQR